MSAPMFSAEELQQQSQGNANAFFLTTIAYLTRTGGSVASWAHFTGELFAPSWREATSADASQLARIWALNFASVGATVEALEGDGRSATVAFSNWPSDEDLRDMNLNREDVDPFFDIGNAIMAFVGAKISWSRAGDHVTFTISK